MNVRPQTHVWENTLSKSDMLSSAKKGGVCGATSGDQNVLKHEWAGCQVQQHEYIKMQRNLTERSKSSRITTLFVHIQCTASQL